MSKGKGTNARRRSPKGDIFLPAGKGRLVLADGATYEGKSFGDFRSVSGEVVFTTGMTGYPEALTDPSYAGQILVFSYPLIGNYGVPGPAAWESARVWAAGVIVVAAEDAPSRPSSAETLHEWLRGQGVPALMVPDTREIVLRLREKGSMPGKIVCGRDTELRDPNKENLVAKVSPPGVRREGGGRRHIVLIDCGAKRNIARELLARGVSLTTVPFDHDVFSLGKIDGIVVSNGPGDPKSVKRTINTLKKAMDLRVPVLGICLGHQLLALAGKGDTRKLKFGHRGHNQPVSLVGTERSYLTTQNHGYAVSVLPPGFREWFRNGNDGTNEGLMHKTLPFMSVQFHPEAAPGPEDTNWVFDEFLSRIKRK